jgi:hypothetical protein
VYRSASAIGGMLLVAFGGLSFFNAPGLAQHAARRWSDPGTERASPGSSERRYLMICQIVGGTCFFVGLLMAFAAFVRLP